MAGRLFPPGYQVLDGNGAPMSGALLYFYETNTSTPQDTYSDSALATANANPVVADSAGRFGAIFGGSSDYKVILKTSAGVTVYTADPVSPNSALTAATQTEADARTSSSKAITPATIADGVGLQGASIASAAALNIPDVGDYFTVTGTTGITSIESRTAGRRVKLRFAGVLTITHDATALILRGTDIKTAAGDVLEFISEGSGNWRLAESGPAEEGSWTPALAGATTAGTQTYSTQVGRYIRNANLVTAWFQIVMSAKDATTAGTIRITGLPFTASNVTGLTFPVALGPFDNVDLSATRQILTAQVVANTTRIDFYEVGDNTASVQIVAAAISATTAISGSVTYRIN